ncbi:hypothetical protein [Neisseria lactamica]|uniref:hypothetical protein n=1 Tax=Neisseria lactamica TaxID=486 RepID=UPI0015F0EBA2|nr:hypothetical protein [Neisseria lactamica]
MAAQRFVGWASAHQFRHSNQIRHSPPKTETAESRRFAKNLDVVEMVELVG